MLPEAAIRNASLLSSPVSKSSRNKRSRRRIGVSRRTEVHRGLIVRLIDPITHEIRSVIQRGYVEATGSGYGILIGENISVPAVSVDVPKPDFLGCQINRHTANG